MLRATRVVRVPEGRILPRPSPLRVALARSLRGSPCLLLPCAPTMLLATTPLTLSTRIAATAVVLGISLFAFTKRKR